MITVLVVQSFRDEGQTSKGCPRGGGQEGGGPPAIVQSGGCQTAGTQARFYAFSAKPYVVASDTMITCIISVFSWDASVLFYPGSTNSYISYFFAHFLDIYCESLVTHVCVHSSG